MALGLRWIMMTSDREDGDAGGKGEVRLPRRGGTRSFTGLSGRGGRGFGLVYTDSCGLRISRRGRSSERERKRA